MSPPVLSVLIPWCDRPELARALDANRDAFANAGAEVVLINCGGDLERLDALIAQAELPLWRRVHLPGASFNKALALNLGAHAARADTFFHLDADVLLEESFLADGLERLREGTFLTLARVVESEPEARRPEEEEMNHLRELAHVFELVDREGRRVRLESNRVGYADQSRAAPGMILLRAADFRRVDGMNSDLEGWSWEDLDLLVRLQFHGLERLQAGRGVHLSHGDEKRALGGITRPQSEARNFSHCLVNYRYGHHVGTFEDDVRQWKDRLEISSNDIGDHHGR